MQKYLLIFLFAFFHLTVLGQEKSEKKVTATFTNIPLTNVLLDFEKQTGYKFYFDVAHTNRSVSGEFKDTPISKALETVLQSSELKFTIDDDQVFVYQGAAITVISPQLPADRKTTNQDLSFEEMRIDTSVFANKKYLMIGKASGNTNVSVTLSGHLIRLSTKKPVTDAEIIIDNRISVKPDSVGYFSFKTNPGKHILAINSTRLQQELVHIEVYSSGNLNIGLHEKTLSLKEVVIVSAAARRNIEQVAMGVERLDIKRIKKIPTVFGEPDILKVILTLPGVKSTGEASAGFNVRGGATDQNLILFDHMTVYNPTHFLGFFSAFNSEIVKDIELYKSSIPTKYGGRLSSVLEINGISGDSSKIKGSAGIGLITSRFNIEGPIAKNKTSFVFGGRTTYSDLFLTLLPKTVSYKKSSISFYDMNLKLTHRINSKNTIGLTGYLSHDDFRLDSDTTNTYNNKNLALNWRSDFSSSFQGELVLGYDGYEYDVQSDGKPTQAFELTYGVQQYNGKLNFKKSIGNNNKLNFGIDSKLYKIQSGKLSTLGTESLLTPIHVEPEQGLESAIYLNDNITVTKKLSFDLGVRYSFYNYLGPKNVNFYKSGSPVDEFSFIETQTFGSGKNIKTYSTPEFRVAGRYTILDNLSIKASYNTLAQYIHLLSNTTSITPTDVWKLSDNNIKPQNGSQVSFGIYKNTANNTIELSVEGYYKKIKDYIDYKSGAKIILNEQIEREVLRTDGKAYGVEFMLKKNTGKFNGWLSYTYSRTFLRTNDPTAGELINDGNFYPSNYDKPHDATLVGNYAFSSRFSFSLNTTYSTGRPITLPIGKYYYLGSERLLYSDRNEYRVPDYFRLDISFNLDGNHKLRQRFHSSWNFGLYNVTGRNNAYSVFYNQEGGRIKGYKLTVFSNPMPFVNYNIKF